MGAFTDCTASCTTVVTSLTVSGTGPDGGSDELEAAVPPPLPPPQEVSHSAAAAQTNPHTRHTVLRRISRARASMVILFIHFRYDLFPVADTTFAGGPPFSRHFRPSRESNSSASLGPHVPAA